jgi:hypothetical protein
MTMRTPTLVLPMLVLALVTAPRDLVAQQPGVATEFARRRGELPKARRAVLRLATLAPVDHSSPSST